MFSYKTKVRIHIPTLKEQVEILAENYHKVDPTGERDTTAKRSAFNCWNNLNHFYLRLIHAETPFTPVLESTEDTAVIEVTGSAKGNTARVYFQPSVTSLTKEIRKAIVPMHEGNIFCYFDLKAAEFALRAVQAGDNEALKVYHSGEDIYMHFAPLFPQGTPRKIIKTILIANMYGKSAYSTAKDLGVSETQAQRLLDDIAAKMPLFTMLKRSIIVRCQRANQYLSPRGFDQNNLIPVAQVTGDFNPCMAWSAYTQSALGFIFQDITTKFLAHQKGVDQTFLTVFDSVIAEIRPESVEAFKKFMREQVSPLMPDQFKTGTNVYSAMYE